MAELEALAYRGMPRLDPGLKRAPGGDLAALGAMMPAAEKFAGALASIPQGLAKLAMTPGTLMKPNPYGQGTEEWFWYENNKQKTAMEWGPEMAVNMFGVGTPMAASGAAGIFGGKLAKTADHAALARAEKMAAEGADKSAIWNDTGWFKGADNKWRFEIDDSKAALSPRVAEEFERRAVGDQVPVQNADRFMDHKELFAAYPDLWRVNTRLTKGGGYPYQPSGQYMVRESGAENIGLDANTLGRAQSMNLHELQHAIQRREGLASGADFNLVGRDAYQRSAGEVEAYNVQLRKFMTPEERKKAPPWETQAYPNDQQIVKFYEF